MTHPSYNNFYYQSDSAAVHSAIGWGTGRHSAAGAKNRQNRAQNDQKCPLRRRAAPVEHLSMLARGSAPAAPQALGAAGGENFEILPKLPVSLAFI